MLGRIDWIRGKPTGIRIPTFDDGRLSLLTIRQPPDLEPKYREVFKDRPGIYPGIEVIRPSVPLVVCEGQFDALLLGQELVDLASVITLGSASTRPSASILETASGRIACFLCSR